MTSVKAILAAISIVSLCVAESQMLRSNPSAAAFSCEV